MAYNFEQKSRVVGGRIEKRQRADAMLLQIFGLDELPEQRMSAREQEEFGTRVACGDQTAKREYIMRRLRFAMMIALDIERDQSESSNLTIEDHLQNVIEEIQKRLDEYPLVKDKDFAAHMGRVITPAQRQYHKTADAITMPTRAHNDWDRIEKFKTEYGLETGKQPSSQEIADALGLKRNKIRQLQEAKWRRDHGIVSLESADENLALPDRTTDELIQEQVQLALERLPYPQQRVLRLRFGLDGGNPMTLQEIGDLFGLSHEKIRKDEVKALERLKPLLEVQEHFANLRLVK